MAEYQQDLIVISYGLLVMIIFVVGLLLVRHGSVKKRHPARYRVRRSLIRGRSS
jgi:hypothetical protein